MSNSRLFYHGTNVEVCLGDRVKVRRWLRKPLDGVVCYISGISPKHPDLEEDIGAPHSWAIQLSTGSVLALVYWPEGFQPPKRIEFVGRGSGGELDPGARFL